MAEPNRKEGSRPPAAGEERDTFRREVEKKEQRKMEVREHGKESVWFGLGMFGLVGWSVAIPTLIGIGVGLWLDEHWQAGRISWTLTFLMVGVFLGCLNAWFWVARERDAIFKRDNDSDGDNG